MSTPCRFLFSDADADLIDRTELKIQDLPLTDDWPQGMVLRCKTSNNARIMVRPFAECKMRFLVEPSAPGILPKPEDVVLDESNYLKWKVIGVLILELEPSAIDSLAPLAPDLLVKPNRFWLGPVTIPKEFLLDSLTQKDRLERIPLRGKKVVVSENDPAKELRWQQHAIADFLAGIYEPLIRFDDAIRMPMPLMGFNPAENIHEMKVFAAKAAAPQDALDNEWDPGQTRLQRKEARRLAGHPRNGAVPARLVYQELRSNMVPAATDGAKAIRDDITTPAAGPRVFYPIRFTRTLQAIDNCSLHFPEQTVIFNSGGDIELRRQRLPAHGILWVDGNFYTNFSAGTTIRLEGFMSWLPGSIDVWKLEGERAPVSMTTGPGVQHILVRLPMSMAMLEDRTRPFGDFLGCTYLSMRRTVRSWIDNRIAGGRMNNDVETTLRPTRDLLDAIDGLRSRSVACNLPDPSGSPDVEAEKLLPILELFFDGPCPQHPIPGVPTPSDAIILTRGRAAYWLWQSGHGVLKDPRTVRNFSDNDMGRGGPGAIVSLELGSYHCNIPPPADAGDAYVDQVIGVMTAGLTPGAITQLWRNLDEYRVLIDRRTPGMKTSGHSPVFVEYTREGGQVTGLRLIDQSGRSDYDVTGVSPNRRIAFTKVWVAANWME
jgi:hypothetical protein